MNKNVTEGGTDRPVILSLRGGIIAALKPAGVLSEDAGEDSMPHILRECLAQKGVAGDVYAVHRLDRAVGGVMVYALNSAAAADLSRQITEGVFLKEYFAVLNGVPISTEGELCDLLFFDRSKNKSFIVKKPRRGVREARLEYRLIKTSEGGLSLVHIRLITGRTHQIRAQFANLALPLWGDRRYGSPIRDGNIALWSARIVFRVPGEEDTTEIRHAPPDVYPWSLFGSSYSYLNIFPRMADNE